MGRKQKQQKTIWMVAGVAVVAVAALVGLSLYQAGGKDTADGTGAVAAGGQRNVLGKDGAKVTLVEYGDFL